MVMTRCHYAAPCVFVGPVAKTLIAEPYFEIPAFERPTFLNWNRNKDIAKGSGFLGAARYREFEARFERSASEEFLVGPHPADEDGGRSRRQF
jgi:hypothetical protein